MLTARQSKAFHTQNGVVLIFTVVLLVVMTIGAAALTRSILAGNEIAGNLAFRKVATAAADTIIEGALDSLEADVLARRNEEDRPQDGYYASSQTDLDRTGRRKEGGARMRVDWDHDGCGGMAVQCLTPSAEQPVGTGYKASYIIHRLCKNPGPPSTDVNACATVAPGESGTAKRGALRYGDDQRFEFNPEEYYRITARVKGPRNTVSFVEAIAHF